MSSTEDDPSQHALPVTKYADSMEKEIYIELVLVQRWESNALTIEATKAVEVARGELFLLRG